MQMDKQWHNLIAVDELEAEWMVPASLGKRQFAVYYIKGEVYITRAQCTHAAAKLCDGYLQDYQVECPLHQGSFDIRSGEALYAPATRPLLCFDSRVENDMVQVLIQAASNAAVNSG